ncbi:MAG: DNA sulfur modification protein DndB [Elusimicrobia bacterium]|nr:DNA sulfur modification protein DndB [Elusimicrobiota bacterium]MDE2424831.1 DNA sulfur modification protein DndB [Elusimicrobiota bacterium]
MKVTFPAMKGKMGGKDYYSCQMRLGTIPKMFTFRDWAEFTAEQREQRILNMKRIPEIARYILENEDNYLFSSITASYKCRASFVPCKDGSALGELEMDFEEANFVINDGQHRCAAIAAALKENPALAEESISVLLFPYESLDRVQQMFSDLNRFVAKTSKSLDILYDKRDPISKVTLNIVENVPAFKGFVDKDVMSLPARSPKLFTLSAIYDANVELLGRVNDEEVNEATALTLEFWNSVSKVIPAWMKVKNGELKAVELRQEFICAHSVILRALGALGQELIKKFPKNWKERLMDITLIDWRKVNPEWENVCIIANSVVSNRQARLATKAYLKRKMALELSEPEQRAISHLLATAAQ